MSISEVVTSPEVLVSPGTNEPGEQVVSAIGGGGGGGGVPPGLPMTPPRAGKASTRVSKVAASVDFSLLISVS